jgi:predicted component of type VI protein secretion system
MLRIAAPSVIDQVLGLSVSALRVEPTRRIPPGMPVDERASYFRLLQHGPYWDAIAEEQSLALFLPSEYADVSLDLIAT